jgi:protein TonB
VGIPGQPPVATMPPVTIPGGPPQGQPTVIRGGEMRKPPPLPNQPPPPVTEPPRPMVREVPPVRRPPVGRPPDTRGPVTRPGQRPLAPLDTLDRRR